MIEHSQHLARIIFVGVLEGVVDHSKRAVKHRLADVSANRHLGEFVFDQPEVGDSLAELMPLFGVPDGLLKRELHRADRSRSEFQPANVQHVESDLVSAAYFAEDVLDGDVAVFEHQRGCR